MWKLFSWISVRVLQSFENLLHCKNCWWIIFKEKIPTSWKKFQPVGKKFLPVGKKPSGWKKSPRLNKFLPVGKKIPTSWKKILTCWEKNYVEDEMNIFVSNGYFSEIR